MAVLAHPDDECFGRRRHDREHSSECVDVFLLTATRGDRGYCAMVPLIPGIRPAGPGGDSRAELRAAASVLACAVSLLIITTRIRRGEPARSRREHCRAPATRPSRRRRHARLTAPTATRPRRDFSIHHGGDRGRRRGFAVADVGLLAACRREALLHRWPESAWAVYQAAFRKLTSLVVGVERQATPWPDWAVTTVLDTRRVWPTVWRAISCHESQVTAYDRLKDLSPDHHEALWGRQSFYRVFSAVNGGRALETDLFDGIPG